MMLDAEDYFVAQQAERRSKELRQRWDGRLVTLNGLPIGHKYFGRKGVVKGVLLDADKGRWLFLVMVIRVDGTDVLNADPESRMYRPLYHFEVEPERWTPTSRERNTKPDDIWFGEGWPHA